MNSRSTTVLLASSQPTTLLAPWWAEVTAARPEAPGVVTLSLRLRDPQARARYRFRPGQFNMLSLPGFGEAAISISSDPETPEVLQHTVRAVGSLTRPLTRLHPGDIVGLRGPFGAPWPLERHRGADIILVTGGIGLAPLRPVVAYLRRHREDYGRVILLYGARTPHDLLYTDEYAAWEKDGIEVLLTVDRAEDDWQGAVGVVPMLFYRLRPHPDRTVVLSCGPEIMMHFVVYEAMARHIPFEHIYLSLERNMKCGQGLCGHCQIGPYFICRDGPVFSYDALAPFFHVEGL